MEWSSSRAIAAAQAAWNRAPPKLQGNRRLGRLKSQPLTLSHDFLFSVGGTRETVPYLRQDSAAGTWCSGMLVPIGRLLLPIPGGLWTADLLAVWVEPILADGNRFSISF